MTHHAGYGDWTRGGMPEMTIPAPMAFFGMLVGMMMGFMLGAMFGKKKAFMMMAHKKGMKGFHHHHGYGMGPCCAEHGDGGHRSGGMGQAEGGQSESGWSSRGGNQEEPRDEGE